MKTSQIHFTASLSQFPEPLTHLTDDEIMMRDMGKNLLLFFLRLSERLNDLFISINYLI